MTASPAMCRKKFGVTTPLIFSAPTHSEALPCTPQAKSWLAPENECDFSYLVVRYRWVGSKLLAGHSVTCTNALHYMFRTLPDPTARLYAMLEAVEWTTSFLQRERARPALREKSILDIAAADLPPGNETLERIFSLLPPRRFASLARPGFEDVDSAMEITFAWAQHHQNHHLFLQTAQRLMCLKSTPEVHDFKYPIALFENYRYASDQWKPNLLAASVHVLHGTEMEDSGIVQQARERLGG